MTDSILTTTKKILGVAEDDTAFDLDIQTHLNGAFAQLWQLGVGPTTPFFITGADEEWDTFLQDDVFLNMVRPYVYLKVRLAFDPPTTSYLIESLRKQAEEMEWRMNVYREEVKWNEENPV